MFQKRHNIQPAYEEKYLARRKNIGKKRKFYLRRRYIRQNANGPQMSK